MRQAFSLVELSIVLVILGLLTGGILAGQSLIRAAELRAVSTEYSRYVTTINTFRDKYRALPGDMPNATSFWGALVAPGANNCFGGSTDTRTCNGNGDSLLYSLSSNATAGPDSILGTQASYVDERYSFWQHLSNAGLIEGQYKGGSTGTFASGIYAPTLGTTIPASKLSSGGWLAWTFDISSFNPASQPTWPGGPGQSGRINAVRTSAFILARFPGATDVYDPLVKSDDAWNIDTKMDDGKPGTGKVRADEGTGNCTGNTLTNDVNAYLNAQYVLASPGTCTLFMLW